MHKLRFRQIHLDFHTSEKIANIGGKFDRKKFQKVLTNARVNSITCFSKCHHGWSYHPTKVGKPHPHLDFGLLSAQYDAAKEIDINVPIYLSAGVDNVASSDHPEWREVGADGQYIGWAKEITEAGFHLMCFNSPYLDYLCNQIREAVELFPEADGIFLDIISQGQCCCKWCMEIMEANGWDARIKEDRKKCSAIGLERYYADTTAAAKCLSDDMPVFHNSGHIARGNHETLKYFSHLELESLPTGGWGYDHFPISAKYCSSLSYDFLGMTGKFHTTWGEFGGFKHPNALRYECAAMLAYGAKCSVGDQLHPDGEINESTYEIIGEAYREVEQKEPWCYNGKNISEIGLLSSISLQNDAQQDRATNDDADIGAGRILLEGQFLFDVIDTEMDFGKYKVMILPDEVRVNKTLKTKLDEYLAGGGKLLLTGESGLWVDKDDFAFDIGAAHEGPSEYQPDYVLPIEELRADFVKTPLVMYTKSQRIKAESGKSLGDIYDPYFNRAFDHFCSHQHTPNKTEPSGYDCGVLNGSIMYLAHPVFKLYRGMGAVAYKEYVTNAIKMLLGQSALEVSMPSTSRVSLMHQPDQKRYILHLLYANTINRGGEMDLSGGTVTDQAKSVEVIEDLTPLVNVKVRVNPGCEIKKVTLEPQGKEIDWESKDGYIELTVDEFTCHQMVVLHYA
jgi:hypothetical protein